MAQRLEDLQVNEVSLVKRGANRRRFLLAKSGEVEFDETIAKILDEPAEDEKALIEAFTKAGGDDELLHAVSAFARIRESLPAEVLKAMDAMQEDLDDENANGKDDEADDDENEDELAKADADAEHAIYKRDFSAEQRKDLAAKGHALPNGSYPIESKADIGPALTLARSGHGDSAAGLALIKRRAKELGAEDQLPDDLNKEATDMTDTATVPVKKEDGTWDLSGVPEDQRAAVEAVIKSNEDEKEALRKAAEDEASKADQAIAKADAIEAKLEKAAHVKAAEGYTNLAKSADELGELLYDISKAEEDKHLPEGTSEKLTELLKAANEAAADVFKEAGRIGHGTGNSDADTKIDAAAAELRKADPSLTEAQAITKALENDPSLYDEYRKEVA